MFISINNNNHLKYTFTLTFRNLLKNNFISKSHHFHNTFIHWWSQGGTRKKDTNKESQTGSTYDLRYYLKLPGLPLSNEVKKAFDSRTFLRSDFAWGSLWSFSVGTYYAISVFSFGGDWKWLLILFPGCCFSLFPFFFLFFAVSGAIEVHLYLL